MGMAIGALEKEAIPKDSRNPWIPIALGAFLPSVKSRISNYLTKNRHTSKWEWGRLIVAIQDFWIATTVKVLSQNTCKGLDSSPTAKQK